MVAKTDLVYGSILHSALKKCLKKILEKYHNNFSYKEKCMYLGKSLLVLQTFYSVDNNSSTLPVENFYGILESSVILVRNNCISKIIVAYMLKIYVVACNL